MSASPSAQSSGKTPNSGSPKRIRRPRNADPLVRPKPKRPPPQPLKSAPKPSSATPNGNPLTVGKNPQPQALHPLAKPPNTAMPHATGLNTGYKAPKDPMGFSEPPTSAENTSYIPLYVSKRALMEGVRHHVAKFASKKKIDITDEHVFTRPVRLHRRDPRALPGGAGGVKDELNGGSDLKDGILDDKDRAKEIAYEERRAQREADLAQIAPTASQPNASKKNPKNKKTQQVYRKDDDAAAQKESKLRYEEALPWHLEDFDNRNTWVGNYESALSEIHVALAKENDRFYMFPVDKWYKFTPKNLFKALSIEEAESRMSKKVKEPRWFMESQRAASKQHEEANNRKQGSKLFLGKWENEPGSSSATARKADQADVDDLDFEEDRFADDEENQLFEGEEEEAKEAEDRIKRDQLQANVFDLKDEKEYDKAEDEEKRETELEKKLGKSVRKALMKREKNYIYDDDTDENPYSDESSSDDTEEEKRKEEERKNAENKSDKPQQKEKDSNKLQSGASTKGTNTPSGRNKHSDPLKKAAANLKRPGSPNLSDASGTESARKKSKKQNGSTRPTATSTPVPQSRPATPAPSSSALESKTPSTAQQHNQSLTAAGIDKPKPNDASSKAPNTGEKKRPRQGQGSGSDRDAAAGENAGSAPKKPRTSQGQAGSQNGSRQVSRATSPNPQPGSQRSVAGAGSRAGSPAARATSPESTVYSITEAEIVASIPPAGTTINELLSRFRNRVGNNRDPFIALIRKICRFDKETKKLIPKSGGHAAGAPAG